MSAQAKISQVVTSYIKAMYEWEKTAVEMGGIDMGGEQISADDVDQRMNELFASNNIDHIEKQRDWIMQEYCTSMTRNKGYHFGVPTQHHPEQEQIVSIRVIDDLHAEVFTDYTPEISYERRRRYELVFSDEVWLIDQHYLLDEEGEFAEL